MPPSSRLFAVRILFRSANKSLWEETMIFGLSARLTLLTVTAALLASSVNAQEKSVGFGEPFAQQVGEPVVGAGIGGSFKGEAVAARDGAVPDGIEALPRDIFTSDDFYLDKDLWSDQRYFRCNSPMGLESQWGA